MINVCIQKTIFRSNKNRKRISWLRKTEYLTFDDSQKKANFQSESNKTIIETSGEMYRDVSKQIDVINTQFETVKEEVVNHPSKPGVTTVNVKYVLPDKQTWIYPSIFVAFDTDISKCGYKPENIPLEKLEDAELRGLQDLDKEGGQYLAFFVPTDETMNQRKNVPVSNENEDGNDTFTYLNDREFWWKLKPKTDLEKSDNYFFIDREDGIFYNEFQARINLNKRLNREKSVNIGNLKLYLKHRELNEVEKKEMQTRITLLEEGNDEENDSQSEENDDDEPIDQAKVIEDIFSTSSAESD
ncbi:RNA polymerase II-associated factor 1 [Intoshia linei]|uniref:RNA polymerase II-associated factor 1 homolog n=1 Tax=Intoshia linei TaxID=1819745 RepID=A0A177BD79_9BILA|nr:RNA polymerase II-associated factor 1 [Intoshia linei]